MHDFLHNYQYHSHLAEFKLSKNSVGENWISAYSWIMPCQKDSLCDVPIIFRSIASFYTLVFNCENTL